MINKLILVTLTLLLLAETSGASDIWKTTGNDAYYNWENNTYGLQYNGTANTFTSFYSGKYVLIGINIQEDINLGSLILPLSISTGSPWGNGTYRLESGNSTSSYHTLYEANAYGNVSIAASTYNNLPIYDSGMELYIPAGTWLWVNITSDGGNSTNAWKLNDKNGLAVGLYKTLQNSGSGETIVSSIPAIILSTLEGELGNYYTNSISNENIFSSTFRGQAFYFNHSAPTSFNLTNFTVFMKNNTGETSTPRLIVKRVDTGTEVVNVTNTTAITATPSKIVFAISPEVSMVSGKLYYVYLTLSNNISTTGVTIYSRTLDSGYYDNGFGGTTSSYYISSTNSGSSWSAATQKDVQMYAGVNYSLTGIPMALDWDSYIPNSGDTTTTNITPTNFSVITTTTADNITWFVNGTQVRIDNSTYNSTYLNITPAIGYWNLTAVAKTSTETISHKWNWTVISGISAPGNATYYYISTAGSNSNDGKSVETAFATLTYAVTKVIAGDSIFVVNGTYYNETHIPITVSGNMSYGRITITSYNGTPVFQNYPYYTCGGPLGLSGRYDVFDSNYNDYITISNLTFRNYDGFDLEVGSDNIYDNLTLIDFGNQFTVAVGKSGGSQNNTFKNSNMTGMIDCRGSDQSIYYANNSYGWNSVALQGRYSGTAAYPISNITIENNIISNNNIHGLLDIIGYMYDVYVNNNIFKNSDYYSPVFTHGNVSENQVMERMFFDNNTVDSVKNWFMYAYFHDSIISNTTFKNKSTETAYLLTTSTSPSLWAIPDNVTFRDTKLSNVSGNQHLLMRLYCEGNRTTQFGIPPYTGTNHHFEGTGYSIRDDFKYYSMGTNGTLTIQDSNASDYNVSVYDNATVINKYTGNYMFAENGANITYYYQDRSEYIASDPETILFTKYNMTLQPSQNYVLALNTSSAIQINESSQDVGNITIMIGSDVSAKTINISNMPVTVTALELRYSSNNTLIESATASSGVANFSSIPAGSYYITEAEAPASPATPATTTARNRYYTESCSDIETIETFFFSIFAVAIIILVTFSSLSLFKGGEINMDYLAAAVIITFIGLVVIAVVPFFIELIEC